MCSGRIRRFVLVDAVVFLSMGGCRVFVVITFAMMSVGRTMSMMSDYSKAKAAALRIIGLDKRVSEINPHDDSGIILVSDIRTPVRSGET